MVKKNKSHFPERKPEERVKDFKEVGQSFLLSLAIEEAERCLQCAHAPCVDGCPVNVKIPQFILALRQGDLEKAYKTIRHDHFLPSVCGRVCPQEVQCEKNCVLNNKTSEPVAIGKLEGFVGDTALKKKWNTGFKMDETGPKVAVVGSGPASLACAGELARHGVKVTVYEALHQIGGVLIYGIPEFRLPNAIIEQEIKVFKDMGVEFITDTVVGKTVLLDELLQDFDGVFIGVGAGFPRFLNIPGEKLNGVFSSNEFLTRINLMNAHDFPKHDTPVFKGDKVIVIGGGNTAMDAARTAVRMGANQVNIVYRRSEGDLPARKEEVGHAKEEFIRFHFQLSPVEMVEDDTGRVKKVVFEKLELGESRSGGKSKIHPTGETVEMETDMVIVAIGTTSNPLLTSTEPRLKTNRGYIMADEKGETSIPGVYAGGDIVTGSATVIEALGAGKKAARSMAKKFFEGKTLKPGTKT